MRGTALVCGISGQDGAYLSRRLLDDGYEVVGTSRDASSNPFGALKALGLQHKVQLRSLDLTDPRAVFTSVAQVRPRLVFNLAGQSSVGRSFASPHETIEGIARGTLHLLEAVRRTDASIRLFNAGSGDCFGDTGSVPANENSPLLPRSPYAAAKAAAAHYVLAYREAYGLFACTAFLFNHESPFRPDGFVTRKIVRTARRIAGGSGEKLALGTLDVVRDWGWAEEYAGAMARILHQAEPSDFVIATGRSISLREFVGAVFDAAGLSWRDHVLIDPGLARPTDAREIRADPGRAWRDLGWKATYSGTDVAGMLYEAECSLVS